jgi:hypothetical protein
MREVTQTVGGGTRRVLSAALRPRDVATSISRISNWVSDGLRPGSEDRAVAARARALSLVDVTAHNAGATAPTFGTVVSQVVSAAQFSEPAFERVRRIMFPLDVRISWGASQAAVDVPHRKLWEFCYILRAAEQYGRLTPRMSAVGFGVSQSRRHWHALDSRFSRLISMQRLKNPSFGRRRASTYRTRLRSRDLT